MRCTMVCIRMLVFINKYKTSEMPMSGEIRSNGYIKLVILNGTNVPSLEKKLSKKRSPIDN